MATRKPTAQLQQQDLDLIRQIYTMMGETKAIVDSVKDQTAENTRTLRGHNGREGLLTRVARMEGSIQAVDEKIETVKTSMAPLKEVQAAIEDWKRYPSLTWMVRHKTKEMLIVTASVIALSVFIGFPGTYIAERLQLVIELLFSKWLGNRLEAYNLYRVCFLAIEQGL